MDATDERLDAPHPPARSLTARAERAFLRVEHLFYVLLAALLSVAALLALAGAAPALLDALRDWSGGDALLEMIDRLLVALMMIEILHTVRASMASGVLNGEPFLIVGLIASIRRMLVITLESSQATRNPNADTAALFRNAMTELAILGGLILVLVASLYLLRRSRQPRGDVRLSRPG